jgi:hypothetical protein
MILVEQAAPLLATFKHLHSHCHLATQQGHIAIGLVSVTPNTANTASVAPYNGKEKDESFNIAVRLQTMERFSTSVVVQFDFFIVALLRKDSSRSLS